MSLGTPRVVIRLSEALQTEIADDMAKGHANNAELGMEDVSDWIRQAIRERLAKKRRSRSSRTKTHVKPAPLIGAPVPAWQDAVEGDY